MKILITICLFLFVGSCFAQGEVDKLTATIKSFHQALIKKNTISINQQTDKALSYGHTSGWVETKTELIRNLETGYMRYDSFKEDSLTITLHDNMANARFNADIIVALRGEIKTLQIKVLEVWVKKSNRWLLFARQGLR